MDKKEVDDNDDEEVTVEMMDTLFGQHCGKHGKSMEIPYSIPETREYACSCSHIMTSRPINSGGHLCT